MATGLLAAITPRRDDGSALYDFVRNALAPEPSTNVNPSRFDVLLADWTVRFQGEPKILDLGCGDALLLERLLKRHRPGRHFPAALSYLGVDIGPESTRFKRLRERACKACFRIEHRKLNVTETGFMKMVLDQHGPFDKVFLSNLLHELPPDSAVELLRLLFGGLSADGELVIFDPDYDWCFSDKAWRPAAKNPWSLADLPVEWETNAIWYSSEGIQRILEALGFAADTQEFDRSQGLWGAKGRPSKGGPPDVRTAWVAMHTHLEEQVQTQTREIISIRDNLFDDYRRAGRFSDELFVKTVRYFAACASQARRLEAIEDLKDKLEAA